VNTFSKLFLPALLLVTLGFFTSCNEDDDAPTSGDVRVEFEYVFGASGMPWELNTTYKHPRTGDTLTFTEFQFYVSNVRLKDEDGNWWSEPESYHLVCTTCPEKGSFMLTDVPAGNYTEMEYTLGVDSTRNVSGAQTGDLSPSKGMFWSWNTGYIMLKAEGQSPQSNDGTFAFHLGGFSGVNSVVTPRSFLFGNQVIEVGEVAPTVKFLTNPARLWHSSPSLMERNRIHMPGPAAKAMADDVFGHISFLEIE
jgi:hypothetical protein